MASRQLRLTVGAVLLSLSCAALAENAITTEPASVRAGPDDSYPEVAQLDADMPIQVMGCLDDWSWCDVVFEGNRGWMYSPDITYEYQGGYVPFYAYAPAFALPVIAFSVDAYWGRYYTGRPWYGEREQWAHREIQHRPPPGPRPHAGPPPREVIRMDRPHGGPPGDRAIRLGSAGKDAPRPVDRAPPPQHAAPPREPPHDDQRDARRPPDHIAADRAEADRRADRAAPGSAAPERPAEHAAPDRPTPPHEAPPHPTPPAAHAAPEHPAPQHEAHANAHPEPARPEPQRAEPPPRHEEPPHP